MEKYSDPRLRPFLIPKMRGMEPSHSNLVTIAAEWLRKRAECSIVATELFMLDSIDSFKGERPDAIGWRGMYSFVIECKSSRHDFLLNKKKPWYGMGYYRYFLVPQGLVQLHEIPKDHGLLEWDGSKIHVTIKAPLREDHDIYHETEMLITITRCQKPAYGLTIKYYTDPVTKATIALESIPISSEDDPQLLTVTPPT
jgi:hypothetical protein